MRKLGAAFSALSTQHSALLRASAFLYLLNILLTVKIALLELTAFFSLFCLGWAIARKEAKLSFHILYFPLFVYGLASMLSSWFSAKSSYQAYGVLWFKILIFPVAIMLYRQVPRLRELATYAFAIVAGGGACWGLLQFLFLDQRDLEHRISGPSSHVMTFSGLLLPLSVMMLFLWWRQRKWWQLTACLLSTLTLLLTFTRSVWLGWVVAVLAVVLATRARVAFYALPAVILFITFMPLNLFSRLISTFDLEESSNFDRIRMLEAGAEMIRDYPVFGVGLTNVKETYALYRKHDAPRPRPPHLHNNVVQLWAERGILGLCSYLLLLALFFRECIAGWKGPERVWAEVGIAVAVSLTVAGLFEFNFGDTEVFYMMLNLFALVVVQLERPQPEANEDHLPLVAAA
ncbi:MAG TPA: O-antigen ligase family protein [Thermoanaerobaculia bacterium]|nr:O-antigen ligase family protein [Thermoanaerobaculia bacterium]